MPVKSWYTDVLEQLSHTEQHLLSHLHPSKIIASGAFAIDFKDS